MTMTVKEALDQVLADMKAMSPEELRADLDKHSGGEFAATLREMSEVAYEVMDKPKEHWSVTVTTWLAGITALGLFCLAIFH